MLHAGLGQMSNNSPLLLLYESLCENEKFAPGSEEDAPRVLLFPLSGRQAKETTYVVVAYTDERACVFRGEPKLTYWVALQEADTVQRAFWQKDLREHALVAAPLAFERYGARAPETAPCCGAHLQATAEVYRAGADLNAVTHPGG